MDNQMDKSMQNEMETRVRDHIGMLFLRIKQFRGYYRDPLLRSLHATNKMRSS